MGKWMNLKPIVSLDENGKGIAFGNAFSRSANTRKIMHIVAKMHQENPVERYCVVHADAFDKAEEYAGLLEEITGIPPAYITEISPIVALNAGRGAVAVALVQKMSEKNELSLQ
jgi:fatty acid-binding protein DegV